MIKFLKEILSFYKIQNVYFTKFQVLLRSEILLGGIGSELNTRIFIIQERVIGSMVGVSSRTFCRQLFKELNTRMLVSLYILEVTSFLKKYCQCLQQSSKFHNYNT